MVGSCLGGEVLVVTGVVAGGVGTALYVVVVAALEGVPVEGVVGVATAVAEVGDGVVKDGGDGAGVGWSAEITPVRTGGGGLVVVTTANAVTGSMR